MTLITERIFRKSQAIVTFGLRVMGTAPPLYKLIVETQQAQNDKLFWSPASSHFELSTGSEFNLSLKEKVWSRSFDTTPGPHPANIFLI